MSVASASSFAQGLDQTGGSLLGTAAVTISGTAQLLGGYIGGTLKLTSKGALAIGNDTIGGGASLSNAKTASETGQVTIGDATGVGAAIINLKGATYAIGGDFGIGAGAASALVTNAGTLEKTAGVGVSVIGTQLISTGALGATTGTLELAAAGDALSGSLVGAGALELGGGYGYTFAPGTTITVGALALVNGGTSLTLGANLTYGGAFTDSSGTVDLGGETLTLGGAASFANAGVAGKGVLDTTGATAIYNVGLSGGADWTNSGAVTLNGALSLGDNAKATVLTNSSKGVIILASNQNIGAGSAAGTEIVNAGTLAKADQSTSVFYGQTLSTGTVTAAAGANLYFAAAGNSLGGTISGAGQVALIGGATATLAAGAKITVGTFGIYNNAQVTLAGNVTDSGAFTENGAGTAINLAGYTLALSGAASFVYQNYSDPYIGGPGVLDTSGATNAYGYDLAAGAVWNNTGTITQTNTATIADNGTTLNNLAGGVYDIAGDYNIYAGDNSQLTAINNAGVFAKTMGSGQSSVYQNVTNTGTIAVATGVELNLDGASNAIGGVVSGSGTLGFGGGSTTIDPGADFTVAGLSIFAVPGGGTTVTLAGNLTYGGGFSLGWSGVTLNLGAHTLTLNGANSIYQANYGAPEITGSGSLVTTGATAINQLTVGGSLTWTNSGAITLTAGVLSPLQLGDSTGSTAVTLDNLAAGSLLFAGAVVISRGDVASSTVNNAGLLSQTAANATTNIYARVVNTGTISATATGNVAIDGVGNVIGGTLTGAGAISFAGGSSTLSAGVVVTVATLQAYNDGTSVTLGGALTTTAGLVLGNASTLDLAGFTLTVKGANSFYSGSNGGPDITGGGRIKTTGATTLNNVTIGGGVTWENAGAVTENNSLQIGDSSTKAATVINDAGASFLIVNDNAEAEIGSGAVPTSQFINDGVFGKVGGVTTYHSRITVGFVNNGTIEAYAGGLIFQNSVTGTGKTIVDNGAFVEFDGAVSAGQSISFGAHGGGTAVLTDWSAFAGGLSGFASGDAVDLAGFGYNKATETLVQSGSQLTVANGANVAKIHLFASFAAGFHLASDGNGGTLILSGAGGNQVTPVLAKPTTQH